MRRKRGNSIIDRLREAEGRGSGNVKAYSVPVATRRTVRSGHMPPNQNTTVNTRTIVTGDPKRTGVPNIPRAVRGTSPGDIKPRIWKSGSSQVEDK